MPNFLSQLDWRFATKSFDPEKKVSEENLSQILHALRMAPSSFGLQPYHIVLVNDPALRESIKGAAYGQAQITDASALLVFCARTNAETRPEAYVEHASGGNEEVKQAMQPLKDMMSGAVQMKTPEQRTDWSARQAYLSLGFALAACAELGIDSCPMEGFDHAGVDQILDLPAQHLTSLAFLTIGYRKEEAARPKFRFPAEDLISRR
jgi:nitroreductase